MTSIEAHDNLQQLLGAYAVDAVDPDERQLVEDHLSTCPRCRSEIDALREVAGAIGTAAAPLPPALWDRIARDLQSSPAAPESVPAIGLAGAAPVGERGGPEGEPVAGLVPIQRGRARRTARMGWALAAAAAVVAAVLGVGWSNANGHVDSLRAAVAVHGEQAAVAAALAAPGHRLVDLRDAQGTQLAEMVLLPDGRGYTVTSSMPALSAGRTYQLWGRIDGKAISLGLLGNRPARASFTVAAVHPSSLMITVEPAGGVLSPDGPVVASGPVGVQ